MDATTLPTEEAIANVRERVTVLRSEGHGLQAASLERAVDEICQTLPEWLTWLSESEAVTYTGRSVEYLRARFPAWESRQLARWDPGRPNAVARQYRRCILEHRGNADAERQAGRRAARGED